MTALEHFTGWFSFSGDCWIESIELSFSLSSSPLHPKTVTKSEVIIVKGMHIPGSLS
jgi:hypothetical protein